MDWEKTEDNFNNIVGITAGYSTYKFIPKVIKKPYAKYFYEQIAKITPVENALLRAAAHDAFEHSDLKQKGVEIVHVTPDNYKSVTRKIINAQKARHNTRRGINPSKKLNLSLKKMDKKLFNKILNIGLGKNAGFVALTNQVLVNEDKMSFSTFHELGHAINKNGKGLKKILAKSRNLFAVAAPVTVAISLLTRDHKPSDGKESDIHKEYSFIKKHCGLIAGLCMLPTVIEEGLASINGQKLAKGKLSPDLYKKLVSLNTKALGSYALGALLVGVFANLAVYIKDKITGDK